MIKFNCFLSQRFVQFLVILKFSSAHGTSRVISGLPVDITNAPYQVSLEKNFRHNCGGSIIHPRVIITTAHCIIHIRQPNRVSEAELRIRAATNFANQDGMLFTVQRIETNPNFILEKHTSDIGLILLNEIIPYTPSSQSILMSYEIPQPGQVALVSGYGSQRIEPALGIKQGQFASGTLMAVPLSIYGKERCDKALTANGWHPALSADMVCAGFENTQMDACHGDSGGPLVIGNKLVALVAWGIGCGAGFPGVFTSVAYHLNWINGCMSRLLSGLTCREHEA